MLLPVERCNWLWKDVKGSGIGIEKMYFAVNRRICQWKDVIASGKM
jgi:hypothetical protein